MRKQNMVTKRNEIAFKMIEANGDEYQELAQELNEVEQELETEPETKGVSDEEN